MGPHPTLIISVRSQLTLYKFNTTAAAMSEQEKSPFGLNADAKEFSFNPTASEWSPGTVEIGGGDEGGKLLLGHL